MNDSRRSLFKKSVLSAFTLLSGSTLAEAASHKHRHRRSGPDPECVARIPVLGKSKNGPWILFVPEDGGGFKAYTLIGTISPYATVNDSISSSYPLRRAINTWDLCKYTAGPLNGTVTIGNHQFTAVNGVLQGGSPVGFGSVLQWSEIGAKGHTINKRK